MGQTVLGYSLRPHAREGLEQQCQRWKIKEAITFRHEVGAGARAEEKEKKRWVFGNI